MKANVQNLVNNKSIRTSWVMFLSKTSEVWVLRTQLNIYDGAFFAIQCTKAKIFDWVLNTPLKLWTDFTLNTWLWFGWVTWGFSTSFMSTFIQIFQNSFWKKKKKKKKNSNNLMLKTNRAYSRNLGNRSILARKGTFL